MSDERADRESTVYKKPEPVKEKTESHDPRFTASGVDPKKPKPSDDDGSWSAPEEKMLRAILAGRQWHPVFIWMRGMFPEAYERAKERAKR